MRVVQQLLRVVAIVVILAMGAAVAAVTVSQTAWFRNRLRGYVVAQANRYLDGELTIGQLSGNLFSGLELQQIAVATHGEPVITVDSIGLDYNLYQIATHGLSIDAVRLTRPVVHLSHDENGWTIARLIRKQETEADRQGPASPIRVDTIGISDATVTVDDRVEPADPVVRIPKRIEHLDAKLSFAYEPVRFSFDIAHVSFRTASPYIGLNGLSGGIAVRDDTVFLKDIAVRTEETSLEIGGAIQNYLTASPVLNLRVSSDKTSLAELSALVPALAAVHVQPVYEVAVDGPLDRLKIEANVRSSAGQAIGQLTADVVSPERAIKGHVAISHLDLDPIVSGAGSTDLTGDIQLDVQARSFADLNTVKGTVTVDAPRLAGAGYAAEQVHANARVAGRQLDVEARAGLYGTSTTARGRVIIPERDEPLRLDLRGQLRHLDLGRLPRGLGAPVVSTNVNAAYHVVGSQTLGKSRGLRGTRVVLDATFDETTVPGVTIAPGSQVTLDTRGADLAYRADASVTDVDLERIGAAFHIPSLESETYRGRFNAQITGEGSGSTLDTLTAMASGTVSDAAMFGGRLPTAMFTASVDHDVAHITASGSLADFDPAVVSQKATLKGIVAGQFEVDATLRDISAGVRPETVEGTIRATLEPSEIGGLAISKATLDADYRDQVATVRQLDVTGVDANATAHGTVALNDSGESNLEFKVDSPRIGELARLADIDVSGIGNVNGVLTGNRTLLTATGTLEADDIKYKDNSALTVRSSYVVHVPDLDVERVVGRIGWARHVSDRGRPEHQRADGEIHLRGSPADVRRERQTTRRGPRMRAAR